MKQIKMSQKEESRDDLDMRVLRELTSLQCNKFCFDCGQRGTTYVNATIGAFVCSTCAGLLRGLNPSHRVKSLTVASFTEVEMDRVKSRGNEYCTHIWLGRGNPKTSEMDLSSLEKRREFLIQKYEEKLFYVDPREAIKKMKPRAPPAPAVTRSQTVQNAPPSLIRQKAAVLPQTFSAGDISSSAAIPDFFESDPFRETKNAETEVDGASFADFNSAFGNSGVAPSSMSSQIASSSTSHKKPAPPPPDRYAALADLDSKHHQQSTPAMLVTATNAPIYWTAPITLLTSGAPNPFGVTWSQPVGDPFQGVVPKASLQNGSAAAYWPTWGNIINSDTSTDNCNPFANNTFVPPQSTSNARKNPFL